VILDPLLEPEHVHGNRTHGVSRTETAKSVRRAKGSTR
jgi:hypothetical protein